MEPAAKEVLYSVADLLRAIASMIRRNAHNPRKPRKMRVYKYDGRIHPERKFPYILDATEPLDWPYAPRTRNSTEPPQTVVNQTKESH